MSCKLSYFSRAAIVSLAAQSFVCYRLYYTWQRVKDARPPDDWHILNVLLLGLAVVVMIPAFRRGSIAYRLAAPLFWVYPVLEIYRYMEWSFSILSAHDDS